MFAGSHPLRVRSRLALLLALVCAGGACSRTASSEPATLRLVRPRLAVGEHGVYQQDVYLNEELRFYFSSDVERTSVTSESVRITDDRGEAANGQLAVERDCVRFTPRLPLTRDLSDAGLKPGRRYRVEIAGFPRPDGVRSTRGAPLAATVTAEFTTVAERADDGSPRSWPLFDDRLPARAGIVKFVPPRRAKEPYVTPMHASLLLASDKPIDPTTLSAESFDLRREGQDEPLTVFVRLVENEPRSAARPRPAQLENKFTGLDVEWDRTPRAALVELEPRPLPDPRGKYRLSIRTDVAGQLSLLRDFSGQPLVSPRSLATMDVRFERSTESALAHVYVEDFLTRGSARPVVPTAVPGCDGTPLWDDTGRVEVRYPAAAGDGDAGEVELEERETRRDVAATRLVLPAGRTCVLDTGNEPCVLRAQGSLRISGTLSRRGPTATGADVKRADPELFHDGRTGNPVATLSAWLARQLAPPSANAATDTNAQTPPNPGGAVSNLPRGPRLPWTIVIAGGDLVVDGSIEVDTPLLLCAGGRVRVTGRIRGRGDAEIYQVWILGDGGGLDIQPGVNVVRRGLSLDAPAGANPLRTELVYCAMSEALPPERGRVARWLGAEGLGSQPVVEVPRLSVERSRGANGTWRVHFLSARELPPPANFRERWVDDPAALSVADGSDGRLVFFVELVVRPGGAWNPPFVDKLSISWEENGGSR